jgi:hypothetical protein
MPRFLLKLNPWTRTNYISIIGFAGLCSSLVLLTWGKIDQLGNVYALSFLSVMGLFCLGNIMLKVRRRSLRGKIRARWYIVVLCWGFVTAGIVGNIVISPIVLAYFCLYYLPIACTVMFIYQRSHFLRFLLYVTNRMKHGKWIRSSIMSHATNALRHLESEKLIFLTKTGDIRTINRAVQYVLSNEMSKWLKIVHIYENRNQIPPNIVEDIKMLDLTYPEIRLDCVLFEGTFSPSTLTLISEKLSVPKNRMFITTPSPDFPYSIADLGSVRIITERFSSGIQHALNAMGEHAHSEHVKKFLHRTFGKGGYGYSNNDITHTQTSYGYPSQLSENPEDQSDESFQNEEEFIDPHVRRLMGSRSASVRELIELSKLRSLAEGTGVNEAASIASSNLQNNQEHKGLFSTTFTLRERNSESSSEHTRKPS